MSTPDIVGIGAVNLDYIIDSRRLAAAAGVDRRAVLDGFDYGSEQAATGAEIEATLRRLQPLQPTAGPGGSALNTVASIAAAGIPVTVGYVGVRGTTPADGFSFPDFFAGLDIDDRYVAAAEDSVGICLSYTDGGQRSMLTTDGANRSIIAHIERYSEGLLDYLRQAEVVLVTSFAKLRDISPLVDLLEDVKAQAPTVQICCDPGALWTIGSAPIGVDRLLSLADWLLLNRQEFDVHTGRADGEDHAAAASRILRPPGDKDRPASRIVLKGPDRIEVFTGSRAEVIQRVHPNASVLEPEEIVDDTGAGDAFAAGLLPALVLAELDLSDGIELGMRLAGEKLRWAGLSGMDRYGEIYRRFSDGSAGPGGG